MSSFTRYALYYAPPEGPFARFGATWLGWDVAAGAPVPHPAIAGVDVARVTETPRKYGFHATLKPPMRLAVGCEPDSLAQAAANLCARLAPVRLEGLALSRIGRFLALTPVGDARALNALAARLVADLDSFRAPPDAGELARRRAGGLSATQEAHLARWGYPYVMDEFHFHMTLSGPLADPAPVEAALAPLLAGLPLAPFVIDAVALVGERPDGMFEVVHRYALTGPSAASA
jgi:putative phosphonate metabolism protein